MNINVGHFFKLIRWPNLLMTAVAISLHWHFLLNLQLKSAHVLPNFDWVGILLLSFDFTLVMGAGYVINDIYDQKIDKINKGSKQILGQYISSSHAKLIYVLLNTIAILISLYIGFQYAVLRYCYWLPFGIISLYIYSAYLKKAPFVGNLLIAVLCGAVLWLPYLLEIPVLISVNPVLKNQVFYQFLGCGLVASLLSLAREITKDQADLRGDQAQGARTLPIVLGAPTTNRIILICNVLVVLVLGIIIAKQWIKNLSLSMIFISVVVPLIYISYVLIRKNEPQQYHQISDWYKVIMILGMILLPISLSTNNI